MADLSRFLIAFDFDHTVIDENSDIVVRDLLPNHALTDKLESLRTGNGWTDYMQEVFNLLHEFGYDDDKITKSIINIPPSPGILQLFDYLKGKDCDVIIISDSNTYFIDEWLKRYDLTTIITNVYSNPAKFKSGKLLIDKYHIQDWCTLSSINLCKGSILQDHIEKRKQENMEFDLVVYVGDGQNDVCPSLRLTEKDLIFARSGMRLEAILSKADESLKAKFISWETGETIVDTLKETLR